MKKTKMIIGADIALKHGCFVDQDGNILYQYLNKKGLKTTFDDLLKIGLAACIKVPLRSYVVIDWDITSINWGGNMFSKVLITKLIAIFSTLCIVQRKSKVDTITPSIVRSCLNVPHKTNKSDIHNLFNFPSKLSLLSLSGLTKLERLDIIGDSKDAYILTQVYDCAIKKMYKDKLDKI